MKKDTDGSWLGYIVAAFVVMYLYIHFDIAAFWIVAAFIGLLFVVQWFRDLRS